MTRLIAIAAFIVISIILIRYRTNTKLQQSVVIGFFVGLVVYTVSLVISELIR